MSNFGLLMLELGNLEELSKETALLSSSEEMSGDAERDRERSRESC
jgi:hypothetical protein